MIYHVMILYSSGVSKGYWVDAANEDAVRAWAAQRFPETEVERISSKWPAEWSGTDRSWPPVGAVVHKA